MDIILLKLILCSILYKEKMNKRITDSYYISTNIHHNECIKTEFALRKFLKMEF